MEFEEQFYDINDVIEAEITLEPMKCCHCNVIGETSYYDYAGDAYCAICGFWQLDN